MRKILILFTLFAHTAFSLPTDDIIIVNYQVDHKVKTTSGTRQIKTVKLFITPEQSVFVDQNLYLKLRAMQEDLSLQEKTKKVSMIRPPFFKSIIINHYDSQTVIKEALGREYIGFSEEVMGADNWQIIDDPDTTIAGRKVYAAKSNFGGREWVAWFTPEIAVPDGPYKFGGLPGLILKLESVDGDIKINVSQITKSSDDLLSFIPNFKSVSAKRFQEINRMIKDNPFALAQSWGGTIVGNITVGDQSMTQEEFALYLKQEDQNMIYIEEGQ